MVSITILWLYKILTLEAGVWRVCGNVCMILKFFFNSKLFQNKFLKNISVYRNFVYTWVAFELSNNSVKNSGINNLVVHSGKIYFNLKAIKYLDLVLK